MLLEQRRLIESLKTQLHRLLKHQFGRRSEIIDIDQMGPFVDGSVVVEVPQAPRPSASPSTAATAVHRQRCSAPILKDFKAWLDVQALAVLPKSALGEAVGYTLRHWDALCRYTEAGYLEASNNFAERCMRPVALGRNAFLFVGSERAGHTVAIYYSIVQSCKVNQVNPLTYLTYVLKNVRNRSVTLPTPHDFTVSAVGRIR